MAVATAKRINHFLGLPVTLVTDNESLPEKQTYTFDQVVIAPADTSNNRDNVVWLNKGRFRAYDFSPYDETVILDSDMIFPTDISHWWDTLSTKDIWITDKPRTFRGEIITSTEYRPAFVANGLPNVYTAFMYFKKCDLSYELFKLIEIIFNNWERFFYEFMDETRPKNLSGDVAYALAIKILGIESECFGNIDSIPTFVHMKSFLQNVDKNTITENWTKHFPTYFSDDGTFKIGNYDQTLPFHYHIKEWMTDEMIGMLEKRDRKSVV